MKYLFTLLVSILFVVPSFAQRKAPLTLSRSLMEDMARKNLPEFTAKYLVASPALGSQVDKALFPSRDLPVQEDPLASMETDSLSDDIYHVIEQQSELSTLGGYIPSFSQNSKNFIETTGLYYSDMAVMLRHALNEPMARNFSGYFVKDFRELQKVILNPATGQTLDEALRAAYQKAVRSKGGILIITEESPDQFKTLQGRFYHGGPLVTKRRRIPAGLKDAYVMDWGRGRWISYKNSVLAPLLKDEKVLPEWVDITEKEDGLTVEMIRPMRDSQGIWVWVVVRSMFVPKDSAWFEQIQYAKQKGYYVLIKDLPGAEEDSENLSKVAFLFARKRGDPLFDHVYELERGL